MTGERRVDSAGVVWKYVHITFDDHQRVALSSIELNEQAVSACEAPLGALRYCRHLVMAYRAPTDNDARHHSRAFARLPQRLGLKVHQRQDRAFIQTALHEWAYARNYESSDQCTAHLKPWLHPYNWHHRLVSLCYRPPIIRIPRAQNSVLDLHI